MQVHHHGPQQPQRFLQPPVRHVPQNIIPHYVQVNLQKMGVTIPGNVNQVTPVQPKPKPAPKMGDWGYHPPAKPPAAPAPATQKQVSHISSQVATVQKNAEVLETNVSNLAVKTAQAQNIQVLQDQKINALVAGQESSSGTVTQVAEKVRKQEKKQICIAAKLSEETAAREVLKGQLENEQRARRELKDTLSSTQGQLEAVSSQNGELEALLQEERRKREALEQEMTNWRREMSIQMEASRAQQEEMKRQLDQQQVDQGRQQAAIASIDLNNRRASRTFPAQINITGNSL